MEQPRKEKIVKLLRDEEKAPSLGKVLGTLAVGTLGGHAAGVGVDKLVDAAKKKSTKNAKTVKAISRAALPVVGAMLAGASLLKSKEYNKQLERAVNAKHDSKR